jgi:hypothetical protein
MKEAMFAMLVSAGILVILTVLVFVLLAVSALTDAVFMRIGKWIMSRERRQK